MHEMEEGVRSGGGLVKKKNSSGCLIIKKKGHGMVGIGTAGSRKVYESNKKKKRSRTVLSDSESSDELLEPFRRKVVSGTDKFRNGSIVYREDIVEDSKFGRNGEIESEGKRRLDVFEFDDDDEYDGIYGKRMRKDYVQDRFKHTGRSGSERQFDAGSSRHVMIDKRKHSIFDSTSNSSSGRKEGPPDFTVKSRFEIEDDEAHLPISSLRQKFRIPSDEPIRLQGKNGVLKVMVNKKKKMELPHKFYDNPLEVGDGKGSKSENAIRKNLSVGPSFYSDSKRPEKTIPFVRTEKSELKLRKPLSMSAKSGTSETEDSDTSFRLRPTTMQAHGSSKGIKHDGKAPSSEKITPVRGKEGKVKRSYGTEKQLLREKIRNMLVSAGWTIDYRPRRNRAYLDAVYINPAGTAYWSIIKAYDALQKQLEEEDVDIEPSGQPAPFTPLPEELLSKLTRQTQKKLEKEMKMKRRYNGRSKNVKSISMEETTEGMDGDKDDKKLSFFRKQSGKSPKERSHKTTYASGDDSSGTLFKGSPKQERAENPSSATNSHMLQARKSRKIGRCTLLVRSSAKGLNSESNGHVTYTEKRTLLSWLIDSGIVHFSEKVQYMNRRRTRVMLEGWITRDGIHCGCCSKILTVSKFEIHAGSKLRQPFQNIYLESGVSLLQCQIDAWNRQDESKSCGFHTVDMDGDDPNDDTCGLCGDGGDLICCDGCPSTFHQSCLDIQMLPLGDWHCPNCTCKFCGVAGGSSGRGNGTPVGALLTCSLCWKKYHESCSQEMDALPADSNRSSSSFCGQKCRELFDHLQKLLGVKNELEAGFSWSLIHRTDLDTDASHRGFPQRVECNSKLAVALSVMDECFLPIVDRRSRINLIHNVLYNCGSNFSRLNYSGFYTAILERGDEIISAASIRIHGTQLAEMPFIGTRHIYRRQGMLRRLFCAIESTLCSLKVEKLIIPAIAEHMHTWTVVFGFNPLEESHKQEMRSMNMLVFPGTDMLQKLLMEQKTTDGNITANSGAKTVLIRDDHELTRDLAKKSDVVSSAGHDLNICDDASLHNADEMNDKAAAEDSGLQVPAIPSKDNSCSGSSFDDTSELKLLVLSEDKTTLNSQSVEKLTELSADLKRPPFSDANYVHLEIKNSVLYPSVMGKSSAEGVVEDVHEANVQVAVIEPVHDLLDESLIVNTAEELKGDQNFLSVSTANGTDETTKQLNSDLGPYSAVDMECEVERVEDNMPSSAGGYTDDAYRAKIKVSCARPVLDCVGGISAQNTTETINENQDPICVSSAHGSDECIVQLTSDLNQPDALGMESKLNVASQVFDAEIASNVRIAPVEGNVLSSAVSDSGDDLETHFKVACGKPVLDSFGDISGQNTTEEMNYNLNRVSLSTFCGTDESIKRCNSDLNHQSTFEVESEFPVASEVSSEAVVPVKNTHEVNGKVACVEPDHDCFGEISAQNKDINEDHDPVSVSVSSLNCSDESTMQLNSDLKRQSALDEESNLHAPSEVALVGSNILSNAEGDMGKDSLEVNVINACAEPVLKSSGETSAENATEEVKEHVAVSTFHGSDGSTVQFESDRIHHSSSEMETELHMDPEVPSDAMHCLRNI